MQDEIVARLANQLQAELVAAEARRAEQAPTPDSMDLYFQGRAWLNKGRTADNLARARRYFEQALFTDPGNVDALAWSAYGDALEGVSGFVGNPPAAFAAAEAKSTKALSLAPGHAPALAFLGLVHIWTNRAPLGIAECERALELDRNLAAAHGFIGFGKIFVARAEETEAHITEALRLSPRDTFAYNQMHAAGLAKLYLGFYEQAAAWFRRAIEANRNTPIPHFQLGAALAELGRLRDARSAVGAGLALYPAFSIARGRALWTALSDDPTYLAQCERNLKALRMAGLPEG